MILGVELIFYVSLLFIMSFVGLLVNCSGNLFYFLIFFESCMLSLILDYVFISILLDDPRCIVYGLIMFAVAAVESAIGLSLILLYQRSSGHIFYNYSIDA